MFLPGVDLRPAWAVAALFAAGVGVLKCAQHFSFQTQAYDLGLFANVIWNTLHGRFLFNSLTGASYLGDHFSPFLPLLGPFLILWRSAAILLVLQTLALAAAIPAVYGLAHRSLGRAGALAFAALFAFFPYVHQASRFDFHDAVFAVPLYLWALLFWEEGRFKGFWAALAAATLLREDMPLATMGVGIYIAFLSERRRDPFWRRAGIGIAVGAAALFLLEVLVFLPAFGSWRSAGFSYGNLGGDFPSILKSLLDPAVLWRHSLGDPARLKALGWLVFWTGGLPLLAPRRLFLAAIPFTLHFLAGNPAQHTFQLHYAAAPVPFLFYAMAGGAGALRRRWPGWAGRFWLAPAALALAAAAALPRYFVSVPAERRRAGGAMIRQIPPRESVQASHNLVPHLCLRERVGIFPMEGPTRWVLLDRRPVGFHPPPELMERAEAFARTYADKRVAVDGDFELYRLPEAP